MKLTGKFEIRSKKNKKTGIIEVWLYAGKTKILGGYIAEGDIVSFGTEPIALENGLLLMSIPKLGNMKMAN